ncbi:Do family serine endopeptidase [Pelomicrobium sp. G1]|jgi:serine protease DegQ|uniref:Do family serine endopeptidase n=1 Tax=unclassified Pelomicrobium TaxID=2815318 RepID=UPI000AAC695E|nr:MAG: DegQ protease [Burkholderiales bacterium]
MRKLWLTFSQTATIALAVFFVVATLRPELLPWTKPAETVATVREAEAPAPAGGSPGPWTLRTAAAKAMPSVVNIFTSKVVTAPRHPLLDDPLFRRFFGDEFDDEARQSSSLGSGVIVSPEGYVLTNHHVVEKADEIEVALADGRSAKARLVGSDPETDLAVLKIDLAPLHPATFGRPEASRVGDVVLAIGNPFGVGQTVTMGIVSAVGRTHLGINTFENFIQTDAAINPGNSGGALVDADGNLIGINTAIYSQNGGSMGIGFAIPASLARQVMEQIIAEGGVTRGWIGVQIQDLTPELAESFRLGSTRGALVTQVMKGEPAERAGVKPGDVLVAVESKPVANASALLNLVAALKPGQKAQLTLLRNQKELQVTVQVGKRPRPGAS